MQAAPEAKLFVGGAGDAPFDTRAHVARQLRVWRLGPEAVHPGARSPRGARVCACTRRAPTGHHRGGGQAGELARPRQHLALPAHRPQRAPVHEPQLPRVEAARRARSNPAVRRSRAAAQIFDAFGQVEEVHLMRGGSRSGMCVLSSSSTLVPRAPRAHARPRAHLARARPCNRARTPSPPRPPVRCAGRAASCALRSMTRRPRRSRRRTARPCHPARLTHSSCASQIRPAAGAGGSRAAAGAARASRPPPRRRPSCLAPAASG